MLPKETTDEQSCDFATVNWIDQHSSEEQMVVNELLKYSHTLALPSLVDDALMILEYDEYHTDYESSALPLMTKHGIFWVYNHENFMSGLTGVPIESDDMKEISRLLTLSLSRMPEEIVELFGWLSPQIGIRKSGNEIPLSMRITSHDCNLVAVVLAEPSVWLSTIKIPCWNKQLIQQDTQEKEHVIPVNLGSIKLNKTQCRSLREGDVIIPDACNFNTEGHGKIAIGNNTMGVSWVERGEVDIFEFNQWSKDVDEHLQTEIEQAEHNQPLDPNEHIAQQAGFEHAQTDHEIDQPEANVDIDSIPMVVDIKLGSLTITSSELKRLQPGNLINVESNYRGKVTLTCGNTEIGTGKIVAVDGEMAIQIIRNWS